MRTHGEWGGTVEILATTRALGCPIATYNNRKTWTANKEGQGKCIYVWRENGHFVALKGEPGSRYKSTEEERKDGATTKGGSRE